MTEKKCRGRRRRISRGFKFYDNKAVQMDDVTINNIKQFWNDSRAAMFPEFYKQVSYLLDRIEDYEEAIKVEQEEIDYLLALNGDFE